MIRFIGDVNRPRFGAFFAMIVVAGSLSVTSASASQCTLTTLARAGVLPTEQGDPLIVGNHVYAAYGTPSGLVFGTFTDGITWSSTIIDPLGANPRLAAAGGYIFVAWNSKHTLWFARSGDRGKTFSGLGLGTTVDSEPQMAASGSLVAIFNRVSPTDIIIEVSTNNGASFSATQMSSNVQTQGGVVATFDSNVAANVDCHSTGWLPSSNDVSEC
jgi:hypothetical protein